MDQLSNITDKLYELQGRLLALECFTSVLREARACEGLGTMAEALMARAETVRIKLLNQPLPDRVLSVFDGEVERLLKRLEPGGGD